MDFAGLAPLLEALAASAPAAWLRQSGTAYLVVNALHITVLGLGVGAAVLLDLRLWGAIGRRIPLALLGPFLSRAAGAGIALALVTGLWLFATRPADYLANPAFLVKVAVIGLALLNALALHAGGHWARALREGRAGGWVRMQAAVSLALWLGAVLAGRWIGFL